MFDRNRTGYIELENMLLLILGAKDIPAKKIVKTYLCVMGSLLIYTIFSALTGRVENLIYYQEGRRARMALGIGYPTDFSAYIFYGILSYIFIRGKKLRYIELGIIAVMGGVVYWVTDARLNTICILMTAAIFVYNKWRNDAAKRKEKVYEMCPWWSMLLALSPILCAAFMIVGSCLFPTENKVIALLDRVLNYRFYQGYKAIDIYGFHPWGQDIQLVGFGGTTEVPKHYFFLGQLVFEYWDAVWGTVFGERAFDMDLDVFPCKGNERLDDAMDYCNYSSSMYD